MFKLKFLSCIVITVFFIGFISTSTPSIAETESQPHYNNKAAEEGQGSGNKESDSPEFNFDPKLILPGPTDIDSKMLVPGNPKIDPKMLVPVVPKSDIKKMQTADEQKTEP